MEKGVKGFRFDVINLISKAGFEDDFSVDGDGRSFYTDGPRIHEFLQELARDSFAKDKDIITVGEMSSTTMENCYKYAGEKTGELSMVFTFHHLKVDFMGNEKWVLVPTDFMKLKQLIFDWQINMEKNNAWNAVFWCNHDQPRVISRFGSDDKYHKESGKMLATLIHCLRGTPYIYQKVGSVWNPGNVVGPMITNKNDKLLKALELEKGESWLVPPRFLDKHKYVLAPTVKWGVRPGNYSFRTELFGPMLSVVCIENLQQGIDLVNSLEYGLTSGLQSLDEGEQKLWKDSIMAGNLYINRGITGAIVNRQPFGGMKLSAFGGGVKAGGPNYCACFVNIADKPGSTTDYTQSYVKAYEQEFAHARDVNNLYGEQNAFRYLPLKNMVLRLFPGDNNEDAKMIALAARICHTPLSISFEPGDDRTAALASLGCPLKEEALAGFLKSMKNYERIRTCGADIPMEMYEEAARIDKYIATAKPVKDGRVELIHYIKEQSISFEYHRYGSILEVPPVE